jgi:hypothetical protein
VSWNSNDHQIRIERYILSSDVEISCLTAWRISIGAHEPIIIYLSTLSLFQMDRDPNGVIHCDFRFEKYGFNFTQGHERSSIRP